ncbi:MAG: carboxypeptidase-like regulatory domain-containing protein, partial [Bacteroidales bacterium]|nr:carboxypeptidase-like regulatory domain-containing protein [Bacteroidales bacterium]
MVKQLFLFTFLSILTGFIGMAHGQNNSIQGIVLDGKNNEPLPGATILLTGTSTGTVTDSEGKFEMQKIRQTKTTLQISFVGYEAMSYVCDFTDNMLLKPTIRLTPSNTNLEEVVVSQSTRGQVKAMLEQRTAINIKNVVSSEQIRQFPDLNAAEVMQRIPGITVQRDQGEGRYVQLRGTPPELTNFNVNGEQISSPEGNVRYVGMDIIAADQIEYIEVTKVLTPDMDADGIAGNVNVITKTAKEGDPEITASLAGGYNNLMQTGNYQGQFTYGQRYKKLGFQVNASYYLNNQGSHNMEYDYTRGPTLSQAQSNDSTVGAENFHLLYTGIEYRHYTLTRKRIGLSANIDYRINDRNIIYLRGMYNNFTDDETRRRISHNLSDANEPLVYRSTGLDRDIRDRLKIQEISTINLGAEHSMVNDIKLDYEIAYSLATDHVPDYISTGFGRGLIGIQIDKSDPEWPVVHYINEEDSLNAIHYSSYSFDGLTFRNNSVRDENYTSKINLTIPYVLGENQSGFLKLGGKVRMKTKTRDNQAQVFSEYEKISIYAQPYEPLALADLVSDFHETNLLNHAYDIAMVPDADLMREFYTRNLQHFKYDEPETWEDNYQEDYLANEHIYAAYAMIRQNINGFMILGGLRYERTDFIYNTQNAYLDLLKGSPTRGTLVKKDSTASRSLAFLLPQVQVKYALNARTNL